MKAVIMAGGEGTRLRPLTCTIPKPLALIANKPIMTYIIELLKKYGLTQVAATIFYLPEKIEEYYEDGADYDINIRYFLEMSPLGTAGSVKNCKSFLDEDFLVISGDALCDIDLKKAIEFHNEKDADVTIVLFRVENPLEYGVIVTDENNKIERFIEKPSWSGAYSDTVNTGIYILKKECLDLIPDNKSFDFAKDLFPLMMEKSMKLYGYVADGYWCDVGSESAYLQCNIDAMNNKVDCHDHGQEIIPGIYSESIVSNNVTFIPPCIIGKNVNFIGSATIGPNVCIGNDCTINHGVSIKHSVLYNGVVVGDNAQIRGAVICSYSCIKNGANIYEGAIIGEKGIIGRQCEIKQNVKIWPYKSTEDGAIITENIVWGGGYKELFDDDGITGEIGFDMIPEYCSKVAAAFSSVKKGEICLGYSDSIACEMLATAFMSGAMSAGADIHVISDCSYNMLRFAIAKMGFAGGAYIKQNEDKAIIKLFSGDGFELNRNEERKTEAAFMRCDFNRAFPSQIREIQELEGISELYENSLVEFAKRSLEGLRIYLLIEDKLLRKTMENVLNRLNCEITKERMGAIGISLENDGRVLGLFDEVGNKYTSEKTAAFLCLVAMNEGERKIYVPYDAPAVIDKDAEKRGCEIVRVFSEDKASRVGYKETPYMFDALFGAIKSLSYLKDTEKTLYEIMHNIPSFSVAVSKTVTKINKGVVMRSLTEINEGKKVMKEGVRFYLDRGNVLIVPMRRGGGFSIKAEATNYEMANELCVDFTKRISEFKGDD